MLREAGAILLGKTNVPQTLLSFGARTSCWHHQEPVDRSVPGGSGGGEVRRSPPAARCSASVPTSGSIRIRGLQRHRGLSGRAPLVEQGSNTAIAGQKQCAPGSDRWRARHAIDVALGALPSSAQARQPFVPPVPMQDAMVSLRACAWACTTMTPSSHGARRPARCSRAAELSPMRAQSWSSSLAQSSRDRADLFRDCQRRSSHARRAPSAASR
jgi:hypothetical protein